MKIDRSEAFRELEPPPGGAARLRAKLGRPQSGLPGFAWIAGPVTVALLVAIAVFALRPDPAVSPELDPGSLYMAAAFDRLLGRPSEPYALSVSRGEQLIEFSELETRDPRVRIYRLEQAEEQTATP